MVIPKGDGETRRKRQKDRDEKVDPSDPRNKRPMGEKKKSTSVVGTLLTATRARIPMPLTESECNSPKPSKEAQLKKELLLFHILKGLDLLDWTYKKRLWRRLLERKR